MTHSKPRFSQVIKRLIDMPNGPCWVELQFGPAQAGWEVTFGEQSTQTPALKPDGAIPEGAVVVEASQGNPDWPQCCRNFTPAQTGTLAAERGVSESTISGLVERLLLGSYFVFKWNSYCIAFPIADETGTVFRAHCRSPQRDWAYEPYDPLERPIPALIFGRLAHAKVVYIFESQWDAIALIDALNLFPLIDSGELCIVITRGARGVKRLDDLYFWTWADVYAFPQNDKAGEQWLSDVIVSCVGCHIVRPPKSHKDLNDWTRDGATGPQLEETIAHAQFRKRGGEGVENVENVEVDVIDWRENSPISTISTGSPPQETPFPKDSILNDYYEYVITQSQGADSYIIGAVLPLIAAILARNVWVPWANGPLYPNLYALLIGPPGNMKSTSVEPIDTIGRGVIGACDKAPFYFLPHNYSPESLFDFYFQHPYRLLVCDDANATLIKWQNPYDGERLSSNFLTLFDGKPLSESFRRNRKEGNLDSQERWTGATSTNIVFGVTFNACEFRNNAQRAGLQRRFLPYIAEDRARRIDRPRPDETYLKGLVAQFSLLSHLRGVFAWTLESEKIFDQFYDSIDERIRVCDILDDRTRGRLTTACAWVLKISMIFEAVRLCYDATWMPLDPEIVPTSPDLVLRCDTLQIAINHVEACLKAAGTLDLIANRKTIVEQAEVLLSYLRTHFRAQARNGSIILTRSQITGSFANQANRNRGPSVSDVYDRIIPYLISHGDAKLVAKEGKKEIYAFRVE